MHKAKIIFKIFIIFICISSCSRNEENQNEKIIIQVDPENPIELKLSDLVESLEVFPLTSKDHMIGDITDIILTDEKVIVLDSRKTKSIFIFNRNGGEPIKINRIGKGPGEMIVPSFITFDDIQNQLIVFDAGTPKVLWFDLEGVFIKEKFLKGLNVMDMEFNAGEFIIACGGISESRNKINVLDSALKIKKGFIDNPKNRNYNFSHSPISSSGEKGNFYFVEQFGKSICLFNKNKILSTWEFEFGNNRSVEKKITELNPIDMAPYVEKNNLKTLDALVNDAEDFLLFRMINKGGQGFGILDKKSKRARCIQTLHNDIDGIYNYSGLPFFYNNKPGYILDAIPIYNVKERLKKLTKENKESTDPKYLKEIKQIVSPLDENDNPVLFIYKFKKNVKLPF